MSSGLGAWLVIVLAVVAANLPFASQRIFFVGPLKLSKHLGWRLAEWAVLCALTLVVGFLLEAKIGQIQPQGWEFYAAFAFLFATLAFPGFVWRCLRRGS
jgi:hypothetical protein